MKVNENGRILPLQSYQNNNIPTKTGQTQSKYKQHDELQISAEALEMAQSNIRVDGDQQIERADRIDQIKQSVHSGTYEINANKVADKIARYLLGE